jgi:hypothetical protein
MSSSRVSCGDADHRGSFRCNRPVTANQTVAVTAPKRSLGGQIKRDLRDLDPGGQASLH